MPLVLTARNHSFNGNQVCRHLSVQGLLPEVVKKQSLSDIRQMPVLCDNRASRLGAFFDIDGNPNDDQIECVGDFSRVHFLGAGMQSGTILVQGNIGRHAGEQMRGGRLLIKGSAADWLACGMQGGDIHVYGDAADNAAGSLPGDRHGMTGGQVLVHGSVGALSGSRMRRGLLAVGGNTGEAPGFELLAGTILVAGQPGPHTGLGMQRGSIVLSGAIAHCGKNITCIPPTFIQGAIWRPHFIGLLRKQLADLGFPGIRNTAWTGPWQQWHGDTLVGSRGEIMTLVNP
ncbi:MAG: formylmethanofuran dehydrogenase subunit C [Planctomycetaceae bacterium]|jgi:formylmethanofuran dehydrogenase subunit C|nr:formylmethanofuran dehydrogenase subunit C [Planctomycetaceae bacterium]